MHIAVNLCPVRPGEVGGAEDFVRGLLDALLAIDQECRYLLLTSDFNHDTFAEVAGRVSRLLVYREGRRRRFQRMLHRVQRFLPLRRHAGDLPALSERLWRSGIDLLFCPMSALEPELTCLPSVVTVHDIQHTYFPEFFSPAELGHRRRFYSVVAAKATRIAPLSASTSRTLEEQFAIAPARMRVIPGASAPDCGARPAPSELQSVRRRHGIPDGPLFYYPANPWPHKNHRRLVEAFALLQTRRARAGREPASLVLTGSAPEHGIDVPALVRHHGLTHHVRYLGYVTRTDVVALYHLATALIYPSLFEGFGIPILEAMTAGCPVIAARNTSIPEVGGDAVLYIDRDDPQAVAECMERVLADPALRARLVDAGHRRAAGFSFEKSAAEYLALFREAAAAHAVASGERRWSIDGVWPDGWSGPRISLFAPRPLQPSALHLAGDVPDHVGVVPMDIVVRGSNAVSTRVRIDRAGLFRQQLGLPSSDGCWSLSMSRSFVPRAHGLGPDARELSILWRSIAIAAENGVRRDLLTSTPAAVRARSDE
jgi:glycosyltransferase involved in cell wall biosynthesis